MTKEPWQEWLWTNKECLENNYMKSYMDGSPITDEEEVQESNVVEVDFKTPRLKRITGGRPPGENWLDKLQTGTSFLAKPRDFTGWALQEFCHGGRKNGATLLIIMDQREHMKMEWVDSQRFCALFDLFEITEEPEETEQ